MKDQKSPKVFSPGKPPASRVPSSRPTGRTERRRRHFDLRHPWLRPKPTSHLLVLAPNRGRAVLALIRFGPYAGCAIIPDGAPDPLNSTRRFAGGTNTVPARGFIFLVDCLLRRRKRAAQGVGEIAFLLIKNCGPCEVKLTILNRLAGEWHGLSSVLYRSQVCIFSLYDALLLLFLLFL